MIKKKGSKITCKNDEHNHWSTVLTVGVVGPHTDVLWNGVNQGLHFSWLPQYLSGRRHASTEKRHQSLLPYHPVVRFRGLGGPGDAWFENGAGGDLAAMAAAFSPLLTGTAGERTLLNALELGDLSGLDGELTKEQLSAGELLTLLESMVGVHDDGSRAKGIRFGINRR